MKIKYLYTLYFINGKSRLLGTQIIDSITLLKQNVLGRTSVNQSDYQNHISVIWNN